VCYIPDVAILPRWARVEELITLMSGLHPRFSAERARTLLASAPASASRQGQGLSKGMVVQAHLALMAAIDARLMILDEPTLGLDVLSRKAFYEMLIDEWCDGERSVLISTHQVEEIETLLSDVLMLNEGKLVLASAWRTSTAFRRAQPRRQTVAADGRPPAARTRCCATASAGRQPAARCSTDEPPAASGSSTAPAGSWRWASACGPAWWTCSWR
jgi:ABC-type multidrug transport system ATPase subunit